MLLEELEISLNDAIVKQIPLILDRMQRHRKTRRQIVVSTHSEALLSNPGIDGHSIIVLQSGANGSEACTLTKIAKLLRQGFSVAEVLPKPAHST